MTEKDCTYVCSRGIMKSCHVHTTEPRSSISKLMHLDFCPLEADQTVHICGSAIPELATVLDRIHCPFILVTGDCDNSCPINMFHSHEDFLKFIEHPKIIRWYSQNCVGNHPKLQPIPIGLDYHTMSTGDHAWGAQLSPDAQEAELKEIAKAAAPFYERQLMAYSNFHFSMDTKFGQDRRDALGKIPPTCMFYEPMPVPRRQSWTNQSAYAFVVSPHGNGLDCHRTWEAIALGCIPIVKTSPLDPLFEGLPVWIVQDWADVNETSMAKIVEEYKTRTFSMERLTLAYWMERIHSGK